MTISESTVRDKWGSQIRVFFGDWVLVGVLILSSGLCFGLGLLVAREKAPQGPDSSLWIEQLPSMEKAGVEVASSSATSASPEPSESTVSAPKPLKAIPAQPAAVGAANPVSVNSYAHNYVASKSGTKYYVPSCGTAARIKEENRVYFATKIDAEKAGYQPSTTCKGL